MEYHVFAQPRVHLPAISSSQIRANSLADSLCSGSQLDCLFAVQCIGFEVRDYEILTDSWHSLECQEEEASPKFEKA